MITLYTDIAAQLTGRNADSRKVGNNTYLQRRADGIALVLHSTDVLTFTERGITFNSGGWRTVTTKERMNRYGHIGYNASGYTSDIGYQVHSDKGTWYLTILSNYTEGAGWNRSSVRYFDGMTIDYSGVLLNPELMPADNAADVRKLKRDIAKFAKLCVTELDKGMPLPGNGDCLYCLMRADNGQSLGDAIDNYEHLRLHMEEDYVVPSLLFDAVKEAGYPYPQIILGLHAVEGAVGGHMLGGITEGTYPRPRIMSDSVRRAVSKYLKRRLMPTEEGSKPVGTPAHTGGFA